jgi:hypothetical protein
METNMLLGILIGGSTVALLAFFAYRVKVSFDRVTRNHEDLNTDVYSSFDRIQVETNQQIDDIYRTMDSRFDKTEARIVELVKKRTKNTRFNQ